MRDIKTYRHRHTDTDLHTHRQRYRGRDTHHKKFPQLDLSSRSGFYNHNRNSNSCIMQKQSSDQRQTDRQEGKKAKRNLKTEIFHLDSVSFVLTSKITRPSQTFISRLLRLLTILRTTSHQK